MLNYDKSNIFAKMIRGEINCNKVYEDEMVLAFHDIHPAAPIHILVVPKGEYVSFADFVDHADAKLIKHFYQIVRKIANDSNLLDSGCRLITNHGDDAMQTVKHFHVHLIGGKKLSDLGGLKGH